MISQLHAWLKGVCEVKYASGFIQKEAQVYKHFANQDSGGCF